MMVRTADGVETIETIYSLSDVGAVAIRMWRRLVILILLLPTLISMIPVVFSLIDGESISEALLLVDVQLIAILIGFFAILITLSALVSFWLRRRKGLLGPTFLTLADNGLSVSDHRIDAMVHWAAVRRVIATRERLFFLLDSRNMIVAAARDFSTRTNFELWVSRAMDEFARSRQGH